MLHEGTALPLYLQRQTLNSRLSLVCGSTMLTIGATSIQDVVVQ